MGGARAGERVRLKLETPLFVADALLEAAQQQLQNELATAVEVQGHLVLHVYHSILLYITVCYCMLLYITVYYYVLHKAALTGDAAVLQYSTTSIRKFIH